MKTFTKKQIIEIGNKLANVGLVLKYTPRSHSHNAFSLFPQTSAQYEWLKKDCGTTSNNVILYTADEVLNVCPELSGVVTPTKSGRFCRINISL